MNSFLFLKNRDYFIFENKTGSKGLTVRNRTKNKKKNDNNICKHISIALYKMLTSNHFDDNFLEINKIFFLTLSNERF
jgi:hypothetical protein